MAQTNEPKTKGNLTVSFFVFCSYHRQRINKNTIIVSLRSYHSYPAPGIPLYCWLMSQVLCDQGKCKKKMCRCPPGMQRMQPLQSISTEPNMQKKIPQQNWSTSKKRPQFSNTRLLVDFCVCVFFPPHNSLYLMQILFCDLSDQVHKWLFSLASFATTY